jgi:hypothetical protein
MSFQFEILTSGKLLVLSGGERVGFHGVVLVGIYAPAEGSYSEPSPHHLFVTVCLILLQFSTGSRLTARSRGQPTEQVFTITTEP